MQLTEPQNLTSAYTDLDLDEIAAVMSSTTASSQGSVLRWGKVKEEEATAFIRRGLVKSFPHEFQLKRITTLEGESQLPTVECAQRLVVRDLDLERLNPTDGETSGRIVAHADWRFQPDFGQYQEPPESGDTQYPEGYGKDLNALFDGLIIGTLREVLQGRPCFGLHGISTLTPSHLRKGIAKKLVEWVVPYAEQYALPTVLAASPMGLLLYRSCGYQEYRKYDITIDLKEWGGNSIHKHVLMIRWPKDLDRMPQVWKDWKEANETK